MPTSLKQRFLAASEAYTSSQQSAVAAAIKEELLKRREADKQYWDLDFTFNLTEADESTVYDAAKFFFTFLSQDLRAKKLASGIRFCGVYVNEKVNLHTDSANPHLHGVLKFFRKGSTPIQDLAAAVLAAADKDVLFKRKTSLVRVLESAEGETAWVEYLSIQGKQHPGSDPFLLPDTLV